MLEKNKLKVKDQNGNEEIYDILFTFDNEETKRVVYNYDYSLHQKYFQFLKY